MSVTYIYPPTSVSVSFPAGASTEAKQDVQITTAALTNTKLDSEAVLIGSVIETAPITDTASSGLNGRLQRIAQRLTSLIALLPASIGQKLMATSFPVAIASDQSAIAVTGPLTDTQLRAVAVPVSGTFYQVTQPISAAALPLPIGAATSAKQDLLLAELQLKADLTETQPVSIAAAIPSTINAGTITSAQIAVGTLAVRATVAGTAPNAARKKLIIKPSKNNTGAIYLGASGVTTGNSVEIIGPDRLEFEFDSADYFLISDTPGQIVEILEKI